MKIFLKKLWPSLAHLAAVAVVFLDPSVRAYAAQHANYSAGVVIAWGWLLHWATSPRHA